MEGYELKIIHRLDITSGVFCSKDADNTCMLEVYTPDESGVIWLNSDELDQVIRNLLKVRKELKNG